MVVPNKSFKADAFGAALTPTLELMKKLIVTLSLVICSFAIGAEPRIYRNVPLLASCGTIASIEAKNGAKLKGSEGDIIVFAEGNKTIFYRCSQNNWQLSVDELFSSENAAKSKSIVLAKQLERLHGRPTISPSNIGFIDNIEILLFGNSAKELIKRSWIWKLADRSIFVAIEHRSTKHPNIPETWVTTYQVSTPALIL